MANGKKIRRPKETKAWKILKGTHKEPIGKKDVEYLIAGIQQECYWTERDVETFDAINSGKIDWSGNARSKRKPRKHIRERG